MTQEVKGKSIQELKDKVHSGLELLSDEELAVLFQDAESVTQQPSPEPQPTPNPSIAPASVDTTPPVVEAPKGQADLINLVPEKFREKDEAASLTKMIRALQEQETLLTQKSQEVAQLQNVVQELSKKPKIEYQPSQLSTQSQATTQKQLEPEVEIDDLGFLDAPVANSKAIAKKEAEEVARRVAIEQLRDYDTFVQRRDTFREFRKDHPDFDTIRDEFSMACTLHPEWDNDINGLPKLYELAKTLAKAKSVAPAVTPAQPAPAIDIEKLKAEIRAEVEATAVDKAKQAILEEIRRRKAAAGIITTTSSVTPTDRSTVVSKTIDLTPEEKTIQEMVQSGPNKLDRDLGPYGSILSLERASTK